MHGLHGRFPNLAPAIERRAWRRANLIWARKRSTLVSTGALASAAFLFTPALAAAVSVSESFFWVIQIGLTWFLLTVYSKFIAFGRLRIAQDLVLRRRALCAACGYLARRAPQCPECGVRRTAPVSADAEIALPSAPSI